MRTVVLGSECPEQEAPCSEAALSEAGELEDAGLALDGAPEEDADGLLDGDLKSLPQDAEPAPPVEDAELDAPAPVLVPLVLDNPSFERGGGVSGDVVLVSLVGSIVPIPPVTLIFAQLPGWYACWALSVNSDSREPGDAGAFQSGGDYVSFVINGTSVRQALPEPMRTGASYSFELDVISRSEGTQNLFVEVRGARQQCGEGIVLGRSPVLTDGTSWTTTCVTFTASDSYSHLLIAPGWEGAQPSALARLWIDNLRQVPSCR